MVFTTADQIGTFAELLARTDLSRPVVGHYRRPLFRATPLGDKYPAVDLIVDVLGPNDVPRGFFAQVKGTTQALGAGDRLPVVVETEKYNRLVGVPAPAYVIGVDVLAEASYVVAAYRLRSTPVLSVTTAFRLHDHRVKIELYREVVSFWRTNRAALQHTRFKDV